VLLLYLLKIEEREYARDLALVQMQADKDEGIKKFNAYRKTLFPWIDAAVERDKVTHAEVLKRMVKEGPLLVTATNMKPFRSRLVTRLEDKKNPMTPAQRRKQDELLKKIGKAIPT
jgi:hypothetical protein